MGMGEDGYVQVDDHAKKEIDIADGEEKLKEEIKECTCVYPTVVVGKCPICLRALKNAVLVDDCLHGFCMNCILQWIEHLKRYQVKARCPLCRLEFACVLQNVMSEKQYICIDVVKKKTQEEIYFDRRKQVYTSEEFHGNTQDWPSVLKTNSEAQVWLDRELRACIGDDDIDVALLLIIVNSCIDVARNFGKTQSAHQKKKQRNVHGYEDMEDKLKAYLFDKSPQFAHEVSLFMGSKFNMTAYDELVDVSQIDKSNDHICVSHRDELNEA